MECTVPHFEFNSHHPHKLIKPSQSFADGFWTHYNNLYLLTRVVNYPAVANALIMKLNYSPPSSAAVERLFSASAQVLTARRCLIRRTKRLTCTYSWDPLTILKHWSMTLTFLIIWELVRPLVMVDIRNVTDCMAVCGCCTFWTTGWHCLTVIYIADALMAYYERLHESASASVMPFFLITELVCMKKLEISWN